MTPVYADNRALRRCRKAGSCRLGAALLVLSIALVRSAAAQALHVEVFKGGFATVNSFIFSNGRSIIVMDVQRKTYEAKKLASRVAAMHLPLAEVLISHGHTDHFTGMDWFHRRFPDARIVVANEAIKRDIKSYALYMSQGGETGAEPALEPALLPRSAANPRGFDYERWIHVLPGHSLTLHGGGTLELDTDHAAAEAPHTTTVYCRELNALFLSDLGYNKVHLWLGDDIDAARIAGWRAELLRLKARYGALNPTVYPGHGDPTDMSLFDDMVRYLDDFVRVTSAAKSQPEAMRQMELLYPTYGEADFFLKYSVASHVAETLGH